MSRLHRALLLAAVTGAGLGAGLAASAAPPDFYSGAEIRGRVVDAETSQPLEGVYVVAQWILDTGLFHHRHVTRLHITETMTNGKGEYYLAAWGPKPRPALSRLDMSDPILTFFKPGYKPLDRSNGEDHDEPLRTSRWHGKTIALEPFRGTADRWADALRHVQSRLQWAVPLDERPWQLNQYWKYFPRAVLAVAEQRRLLPKSVQYRVSDLEKWQVTEEQLRAILEKGRPE